MSVETGPDHSMQYTRQVYIQNIQFLICYMVDITQPRRTYQSVYIQYNDIFIHTGRTYIWIFIILLQLFEVMTFILLLCLSQAEIRYLPSDFHSYFMIWIIVSLSLKWINSSILDVMQLYKTCRISIYALHDIIKWNSSSISWLLQILHVLSSRFKLLKHPISICKGRMPNLIVLKVISLFQVNIAFKTKGNVNIKLRLVWDFDCLHFAQYISISPNCINCKQTWCKKIYCMDRVSWLKPLTLTYIWVELTMKFRVHRLKQVDI